MSTETPENPYCAKRWPYNFIPDNRAATLTEAAYGACTLARLLHADANIESDSSDSDDPDSEQQPFNGNIKHGLFAALHVCLKEITCLAEDLEKCEIRMKEVHA